ncbi:deoxyribose-phosphate aldolase [candidate division GN15 bacterium]|uniref:Deoxyribose-phosphate aldolase n=1 Tax=candidate division GN15 bacterium TaxID=2072418 RepID=A0A855X0P4_9BACT|nr:MAG: deoxyribose-phosphate aldolase [candidate division GN15 bacterium]
MTLSPRNLARSIDHTILRNNATEEDIRIACSQALEYHFFGVVVNPVWVRRASELLAGSEVRVISVAGFPLGANRTDIKVAEAAEAVEDGAHEIDMVADIGKLCADRFLEAEAEIRKVRRNLPPTVLLKVIIEASQLTADRQKDAVNAVINAGAQFVKTGTGYSEPVTVKQVRTLVTAAGGRIAVKASGGIRKLSECLEFLEAGATRLGTSGSVDIMRHCGSAG